MYINSDNRRYLVLLFFSFAMRAKVIFSEQGSEVRRIRKRLGFPYDDRSKAKLVHGCIAPWAIGRQDSNTVELENRRILHGMSENR